MRSVALSCMYHRGVLNNLRTAELIFVKFDTWTLAHNLMVF
jgi:hypothetical protein